MKSNITKAVHHLTNGGVVAYPTEFCFGFGCLVDHTDALQRIRSIKNRPQDMAFIVIASEAAQLAPLCQGLSTQEWQIMAQEWPAAISYLVPASTKVSSLLVGATGEIAIRIPDHAIARQLCAQVGSAIVSTSANRRGELPLTTAQSVQSEFGQYVDWVVDAPCGEYNKPSTIIRLSDNSIIRP